METSYIKIMVLTMTNTIRKKLSAWEAILLSIVLLVFTDKTVAEEMVKSGPPLAVVGLTILGLPIGDLVQLVTLVYVVLQIAFLVYRWIKGTK